MADVIFGDDGYLFLNNDTNRVCDQIQGKPILDKFTLSQIGFAHLYRQYFLREELGGSYLHLIAPNKETVLSHLLPHQIRYQYFGLTPANAYLEHHSSKNIPTVFRPNLLRDVHKREAAYYRADTHWTHFGALEYLVATLESGEWSTIARSVCELPKEVITATQHGDLGSKIGSPPEEISILRPVNSYAQMVFTNGIVNEGCVRIFKNNNAPIKERLLFMHDSMGTWVLAFLAEVFSEVICIHYPDFDPVFVAKLKPKYVIFMQVERFFVRVPRNEVSINDIVEGEEQKKAYTQKAGAFFGDPIRFLMELAT